MQKNIKEESRKLKEDVREFEWTIKDNEIEDKSKIINIWEWKRNDKKRVWNEEKRIESENGSRTVERKKRKISI